ncbi:MAG: hypothetical protein OEY01_03145 [Desulfobulbaceae bacterium]|nr:hypothetical protein [Desulfobulbaceae bacterium]HIJ78287.1 hypothetical protein [Deltaproteobacteria bacterium]
MKKYRLLINGQNFLIESDGKPRKHGFYQNFFIEAANPKQAELIVTSRLWHDKELTKITLNKKKDPPRIKLCTFWELDILNYVGKLNTDRNFYLEKRWWQFWK